MKKLFLLCTLTFLFFGTANASLLGTYYNLDQSHPDMQRWITGLDVGYVEAALTGSTPTLTTYGATRVSQWDWWDPTYQVAQRLDSDTDLQSGFSNSWFPAITNTGLTGDPFHFAVHWSGSFYVDQDKSYTYSMGSDDDSWLFIDGQLVLDLGGVHAMTWNNYSMDLTEGTHTIDIFFAERNTSQSGFQLNFFSDLEPTNPVPEPATMLLFGLGLLGLAGVNRRKK